MGNGSTEWVDKSRGACLRRAKGRRYVRLAGMETCPTCCLSSRQKLKIVFAYSTCGLNEPSPGLIRISILKSLKLNA